MKQWADSLSTIVMTLWIGGLWMTAIMAYVLFKFIDDHQLAGEIAGHFFNVIANIGLYGGALLLVLRLLFNGFRTIMQGYFWVLILLLFFVFVGQFIIQPSIAEIKQAALPLDVLNSQYAEDFKTMHNIASVVYMVECVLGLIIVVLNQRS